MTSRMNFRTTGNLKPVRGLDCLADWKRLITLMPSVAKKHKEYIFMRALANRHGHSYKLSAALIGVGRLRLVCSFLT